MTKERIRRGYNLLGEGKVKEAINKFRRAIKAGPRSSETYEYLGMAYGNLGQWKEALQAYKQLVHLRPDDAEAHYYLGLAYKNLGQWEKALESYKEALHLRPKYVSRIYHSLRLAQEFLEIKKSTINR